MWCSVSYSSEACSSSRYDSVGCFSVLPSRQLDLSMFLHVRAGTRRLLLHAAGQLLHTARVQQCVKLACTRLAVSSSVGASQPCMRACW